MKTFADLKRENAAICTINTGVHEGTNDTLTRWYNMWWGALTDTHMQLLNDGTYLVTGSRMGKNFMNRIMYAHVLPTAPHTNLPTTFEELLRHNHLQAVMVVHDGQPAMAVGAIEDDKSESKPKEISIPPATSITNGYYNPYDPPQCCNGCAVDDM